MIEQRVKELFHGDVFSFENDILQNMIGKGLFGLCQQGFFIDIGVPEDYKRLCNLHSK
ncbi:hypothetical protein KKB18_02685 [bacterium]|nr:hypothetical protein [bacterium]